MASRKPVVNSVKVKYNDESCVLSYQFTEHVEEVLLEVNPH